MTGRSHEWIDQRSLALSTEIAQMIQENPELLSRAKENLARWIKDQGVPVSRALLEWQTILNTSTFDDVLALLTRWDEEARRLRQSSPFCGILSEERRMQIFEEFEEKLR